MLIPIPLVCGLLLLIVTHGAARRFLTWWRVRQPHFSPLPDAPARARLLYGIDAKDPNRTVAVAGPALKAARIAPIDALKGN